MLNELRLFLTAVQFFTRLPVPAWIGHSAHQLEQSSRYLPLVGVLVGACSAAVLWFSSLLLPLSLAIALSIAASILVTGAFHEDGLSDYADGMGGGHSREKILMIMKDSRVGAYGVIALILVLLLKYQALQALGNTQGIWLLSAALVSAHSFSRLLAASLTLTQHYVRNDDSARARPAAQQMSLTSFAIATLTGCASLAFLSLAGASLTTIAAAAITALLARAWLALRMKQRLGGYTGDCLGAVQQLSEVVFYLGLLAAL